MDIGGLAGIAAQEKLDNAKIQKGETLQAQKLQAAQEHLENLKINYQVSLKNIKKN